MFGKEAGTMTGTRRLRSAITLVLAAVLAVTLSAPAEARAFTTTVTNFDAQGNQVVRFDTRGDAVDAHDGEIALFGGTYYLYGTSYDCGFAWQATSSPFCGFKVYTSPDLVHWTDRGRLLRRHRRLADPLQRRHLRLLPAARRLRRGHPQVRALGQRLRQQRRLPGPHQREPGRPVHRSPGADARGEQQRAAWAGSTTATTTSSSTPTAPPTSPTPTGGQAATSSWSASPRIT